MRIVATGRSEPAPEPSHSSMRIGGFPARRRIARTSQLSFGRTMPRVDMNSSDLLQVRIPTDFPLKKKFLSVSVRREDARSYETKAVRATRGAGLPPYPRAISRGAGQC